MTTNTTTCKPTRHEGWGESKMIPSTCPQI